MITTTSEIKHFESNLKTFNEIELDDLESIVITEFAEGLPSDTVVNGF